MDIIQMAREMGKAIQATEEYKRMQAALAASEADQELQEEIGKFNLINMNLNQQLQMEEKDDEKIKELNGQLQELYASVMGNANMAEYNLAKQDVSVMMQNVNAILSMCINGENPDTCEIPDQSCTGSCATCGGCH